MSADAAAMITIDHVQLAIPAGGEGRARRFWCNGLGLTEIAKPSALAARGGLWLSLGDTELHLGVEAAFHPAKKAHPGFAVGDIGAIAQTVEALNAPVTWNHDLPGRKRFFTEDPFGNRLEFLQKD